MKCKIKDVCFLSTTSISPKADIKYHLYSLPAFDDGKKREEVFGRDIHSNKFVVPDKCILFNKLNVRFKRIWRIDNIDSNKIASTEFLPLIVDEEKVNYQYFYYLLRSDSITKYLSGQNSNTSGSHKRIDPDDFMNIEISLPSMDEQHRVGNLLAEIDQKIDIEREEVSCLESLARQIYDYWFVQFDFPDKDNNPYKSSGGAMAYNQLLKRDIPADWLVGPLDNAIELQDSKRIPLSTYQREGRKGQYPYYGATGIMDYVDDYIFDDEIILLAEDGSTSDEQGHPIVQYVWGKVWVNNHAHIVFPKTQEHKVYTYFTLKYIPAKLIETGSIQKKINQENLLKYPVLSAPKFLIDRFSEIVKPIWQKRIVAADDVLSLVKLREYLLPLLINGQVRLNS